MIATFARIAHSMSRDQLVRAACALDSQIKIIQARAYIHDASGNTREADRLMDIADVMREERAFYREELDNRGIKWDYAA